MVIPVAPPQAGGGGGSHHWCVQRPSLGLTPDDITETNEFIDDSEAAKQELLSQEEISELRAKGASAEDIMHAQQQRHERFKLKTEFSKEKWRKRKEKK